MKNLFNMKKSVDKDEIARLLEVNPEVLAHFENLYQSTLMEDDKEQDNFFKMNAKQVAKERKLSNPSENDEFVNQTISRIVHELLISSDHKLASIEHNDVENLSIEELNQIPLKIRPQLTGNLIQKDIGGSSYGALLELYGKWKETEDIMYYHLFRQGLDILDLDMITYSIIGTNPNSMGFWFPAVCSATESTFLKIPETRIIKVPLPILQLTRLDYRELNRTTLDIVNKYCMEIFDLDVNKKYFIKTGTYSSKFDFRNALVQGEQEVRELGEYLLFIHHQAIQMASPLSSPSIYGVSTTNEWVVREFIEDVEDNPTIYKGLPLRTEYRFFVDLDNKEMLGVSPYWREDVMKKSFSNSDDRHKKHDYVIYKMHEKKLYKRYNENVDKLTKEVEKLISNMDLPGQWSIDIMQNGEDFYIIDMALASQSALNDCVNPSKLRLPIENWLPKLT